VAAVVVLAACGKKKTEPAGPPPEVTGLAAVPDDAEGIIGADVRKLADSPIVSRAVDQLLTRERDLATAWKQVHEGCKIDVVQQVKRVMLVLGPVPPGGRVGTGPALMIAIGSLPEHDLAECVGKLVGKGGGSVSGKPVNGHTLYTVKDGSRVTYFAFGRADTAVLGNSEAYVTRAIGAGNKALDNPELAGWLKRVDQNAPLWAVGRIDPRVRQGLGGVIKGLSAGPAGVYLTLDPTDGARLEFDAVMASPADAKELESWANRERAMIAMAAQRWSLSQIVSKVTIKATDSVVQFKAPLDMRDVNQMLSVLDDKGPPAQDSAPSGAPEGSASK